MPVRGNLGAVKLSDIFQMLSLSQEAQTLRVRPGGAPGRRQGGGGKTFVFTPDRVSVYFTGGPAAAALGNILVNLGKVTEDELRQALRAQGRSSRRPVGEILVEKGFASQEDIDLAVHKQIEEEIYELLAWEQGEFEVSEGTPSQEEVADAERVICLTFNVTGLLMEAVRRIDELEALKEVVPSLEDVYRWKEGSGPEMAEAQAPWQRRLMERIGRNESLRKITGTLKVGRFDAVTLVAELVRKGRIEALDAQQLRRLTVEALSRDDIDEGLALGERVVQLLADDPEPRTRLAKIYEQVNLPGQAAGHLVEAARLHAGREELAAARDLLERALSLQRGSESIRRELMEVTLRAGDVARAKRVGAELLVGQVASYSAGALETAKRLVEIAPDDVSIRLRVAGLLVNYGRVDLAADQVLAIPKRHLDHGNPKLVSVCRQILELDPSRREIAKVLRASHQKSLAGLRRRLVVERVMVLVAIMACVSGAAYYIWAVVGP